MTWFYRGLPVVPEAIKEDQLGYVYRITRLDSGRAYIGKKLFWSKKSKPPLKGYKRKRRFRSMSDWETYYGSCEELLIEVRELGIDRFRRDIERICYGKGELNYYELKAQIDEDVLLHPDRFYNRYIGTRIHISQINPLDKKRIRV